MVVLHPPVPVAVAARAREVPSGGRWAFEPKLDGYRLLAFASSGLLQSRQGTTSLTSRFPEISAAVTAFGADTVLDGELVALRGGTLEFAALQFGPARRAREGITVMLVAFDLLALHGRDLRFQAYEQRRGELERLLAAPSPHVQRIEQTTDRRTALEWMEPAWASAGVEGVVAKPIASRYTSGPRSGWLKIRQLVTTDAVVLGVVGAASLVLGHPTARGEWRASGLSQPVSTRIRAELAALLRPEDEAPTPAQLPGVVAGLPGGEPVVYLPVRPEVVVEVVADMAVEFGRWRHRPTIARVRTDLTPADLSSHTRGDR